MNIFRVAVSVILLLVVGCTKVIDESQAVTFATGIHVLEISDCHEGIAPQRVDLTKIEQGFVVLADLPMSCNAPLAKPYLTPSHDHRTTLVFREENSNSLFHSGCDCWRSVKVRIEGRLEVGDTLYVTNNGEVVGQFRVSVKE